MNNQPTQRVVFVKLQNLISFKEISNMLKKTCSIVILSALIFTGCSEPIPEKKIEIQKIGNLDTSTIDQEYFQKTLSVKNISYNVSSTGSGSIQQLLVQPSGLTEVNDEFTTEIDGRVSNAEIADLNADGYPELLIYTTSAGSGSYGNVIVFSPNNGKSISQAYFPNVADNPKVNNGYMGHDEFAVVNNKLVQKFPIYKKEDINSNPTGGIRKIQYKLINGESSRIFVIDKIEEFPSKK